MKATVYKVTLSVLDFEGMSQDDVINELENSRYLSVRVRDIESKAVEWSDDHPLNKRDTAESEFRRLFPEAE